VAIIRVRDLVRGDSKFVVNSRLDVKVGLDGVEFLGASASEWVNGGIRIIPGDKGAMQSSYPLYANLEKAQENSLSDLPTTTTLPRCRDAAGRSGRLGGAVS
jgi:paraquat-inducible protein B